MNYSIMSFWRSYLGGRRDGGLDWDAIVEARHRLVEGLVEAVESAWRLLSNATFAVDGGLACSGFERVVRVDARLVYRGRPGLGSTVPPLDWGLTLHPVFLVPYFPGSSVKGVVRSVFGEVAGRLSLDYGCGLEELEEALFGEAGGEPLGGLSGLVFFDAYPLEAGERGLVEGDVLTPHYRAGGRLVSELDAGPTPVVGFSLAPGVRFRFVVGVDWWRLRRRLERAGCAGLDDGRVAGLVGASLVYALERMGLGGKSTRGYGFFEIESYSIERCNG